MEINSLYTALSGIQTTQALLNTTSRNITNAQTPGYVVKQQQAVSNAFTGGALAGPIKRFVDASLLQKLRTNNAAQGYNEVRSDALTKINQLSGDPAEGTSIGAKINKLGAAFTTLAANPQDTGVADGVLLAADDLARTFNQQTTALLNLQTASLQNVTDAVAQVNTLLNKIASLNQQVISNNANGKDPTDLMDQRDVAISDLSKLIGVNAFTDNQGVIQVLSADYKPLAGLYAEVITFNQTTNTLSNAAGQLNNVGGQIGANLQVATVDSVQRLQNLSEIATTLARSMANPPPTTLTLNGTLSSTFAGTGDVATTGTTTIQTSNGNTYTASLAYRPTSTAGQYQLVITALTATNNSPTVGALSYNAAASTGGVVLGTINVTGSTPTFTGATNTIPAATSSNPPGNVVGGLITASGLTTTGLTVTAANVAPTGGAVTLGGSRGITLFTSSGGQLPAPSATYSPPYFSGNISLNPVVTRRQVQVGDALASSATDTDVRAAQDAHANLTNLQAVLTTTGISGTSTLTDAAAAITVAVGQDLANVKNKITEQTTFGTQLQQAIAPQSEVNLDTEMSKLVVLQNLYQANARVVSTAQKLLDTLINLPT